MKAYHEISPDSLESIRKKGLVRTSRGDKGDDKDIMKTDCFLDEHCPSSLKDQGISRDNNLYAYMCVDDSIISITDGAHLPLHQFIAGSKQAVLELDVDPRRCFISSLDTFDALKSAIRTGESEDARKRLAKLYWNEIVALSEFAPSTIRRPEIMITYDIPPEKITLCTK